VRVLGFDPGTATTGYGVVDGTGNRLRHIAHGTVETPAGMPFADRLHRIYADTCRLLDEYRPIGVSIERLYFAQNVTTGLAVAQARGVIALAAAQRGLPIGEYSPLQVKQAVVGHGKATKRQVQEMIKILLNLDALPRPDDAADGLGLAICQIHAGHFEAVVNE
jgi:crossover junction endodeoxyribonuclease RuvC